MSKKQQSGGMSLRSKDAVSGGGTEGALATIAEIGFIDEFTYGGRHKDKPQAALRVQYDIDGMDKPWIDNYTCGPTERYEVVADGDGIKSTGKAEGLNKNSTAFKFFEALEAAAESSGLDIDELTPELDEGGHSVRPLEGRRVRLTNVKFETVGGDTKDLVVIGSFEDEAPAKGKGTKPAGKSSVEDETRTIVESLLDANKSIKKADLGNLVYREDRKNPKIKDMMQLCFKDSFLASCGEYDSKRGVLKAAK